MRALLTTIFILLASSAGAGILPTAQGGGAPALPVRKPAENLFYVSAKAGFSPSILRVADGGGDDFNLYDYGALVAGAVGIDFNNDPNLRLELEVSYTPLSKVVPGAGWQGQLKGDAENYGFLLNAVPYFKLSKNINLDFIFGAGIAWMNYNLWQQGQGYTGRLEQIAFAFNAGIGLEIKISERLSLLPEFTYSATISNVDVPYYGNVVVDKDAVLISNFNFMAGVKYAF